MTKAMIIQIETAKLAEKGILKYTGRMLKGLNVAGEEIEIPEIEPIHTFQGWKKLGYCVKKGEKSIRIDKQPLKSFYSLHLKE